MSKFEILRIFVNQRLTAAAEEIFELFERMMSEYEEQLEFSSKENQHLQKLLNAVLNPEVRIHRAVSTDVQQLLVVKEDVPPKQQEWSLSLDQEDPELPHIKEEQEELWTSEEGDQLQELEEADVKSPFSPVYVMTEDDDENKAQSSQLHERQIDNREEDHLKTEADGENCGLSESAWISDPDCLLQPATHLKISPSSESETADSRHWMETNEPQSGSDPLRSNEVPVSDMEYNTGATSVSSSECTRSFGHKGHLQKHTGKTSSLISYERVHSDGKTFSCSVCKTGFGYSTHLVRHMRIHTGEKPYSCSVCGKRFKQKEHLKGHMFAHTGEKPFNCSVCGKGFAYKGDMKRHMKVHTGEKPFSCSICDARFTQLYNAKKHKCVGEK